MRPFNQVPPSPAAGCHASPSLAPRAVVWRRGARGRLAGLLAAGVLALVVLGGGCGGSATGADRPVRSNDAATDAGAADPGGGDRRDPPADRIADATAADATAADATAADATAFDATAADATGDASDGTDASAAGDGGDLLLSDAAGGSDGPSGDGGSTGNFGDPCMVAASGQCAAGLFCLSGPSGGPVGFCSKTCPRTSSSACPGAPSGSAAYCVVTDVDLMGDKGCAFVCAVGTLTYRCPGQLTCSADEDPPGSGQRLCLP